MRSPLIEKSMIGGVTVHNCMLLPLIVLRINFNWGFLKKTYKLDNNNYLQVKVIFIMNSMIDTCLK